MQMQELLDTLRNAGVRSAKLTDGGQLLEVVFADASAPAVEPSDDEPARQSPLKRSARALLGPTPKERPADG
jgi:hypothetical protein